MVTKHGNKQICPPPEYREWVKLLDGRQALLRPILYSDKNSILALFDRLSPDTRFLRFHYAKSKITPDELERYCCVDYYNSFALVAEICHEGRVEVVGVGRYVRLPCTDIAEIAFVVEDKEQGNGIGTSLLNKLSNLARKRAINAFVAELLNENMIMLDILRKYDPNLTQAVDGNSLLITISVKK